MKSPLPLVVVIGAMWSLPLFGQYGYTPPVPPMPPTAPTAPDPYAATYASTGTVPAAGTGMDAGYGAPAYGTPGYGTPGYGAYPAPSTSGYSAAAISDGTEMLSYGYLEGFYQYTDFKDSSVDGANGLGLALSAQLFNPLFIKGGFNWASGNGGPEEEEGFDFTSVSLGVGAYVPVSARFHVLCDVGGAYYKLDADRESVSFSDGAIYVHPGVRVVANRWLELQGGLMFTSADDYDTLLFDIGAYCKMFTILDLKLGVDFGDETTAWKAGLRVRW